jgi:hypothetical protein
MFDWNDVKTITALRDEDRQRAMTASTLRRLGRPWAKERNRLRRQLAAWLIGLSRRLDPSLPAGEPLATRMAR